MGIFITLTSIFLPLPKNGATACSTLVPWTFNRAPASRTGKPHKMHEHTLNFYLHFDYKSVRDIAQMRERMSDFLRIAPM